MRADARSEQERVNIPCQFLAMHPGPGQPVEHSNPAPQFPVLKYLRSHRQFEIMRNSRAPEPKASAAIIHYPLTTDHCSSTPPSKTMPHRQYAFMAAVRLNQSGGCQSSTQSDHLNGREDEGLVKTDTVCCLVVSLQNKNGMCEHCPHTSRSWCPRSDSNGDALKGTGPQPAVYTNSTTGAHSPHIIRVGIETVKCGALCKHCQDTVKADTAK